ncbi:hypothetical protein ABKA04_005088 [Annulohypoxylon sp. FPYF3050]
MAHSFPILGPLYTENLQNQGLLGPGNSPGSRRIHKRLLNPSSFVEYSHISFDIHVDSPEAENAFVTIPTHLISRDTLDYVGLSVEKADDIWWQWTNWPEWGPGRETDPDDGGFQVTFYDFITARLHTYQDVHEDDDVRWRQCLATCGMSENLKNAIMDPDFKNIRLTNSCIFWVEDTIKMRYSGLEDIETNSHRREREFMEVDIRPGGSGIGSEITTTGISPILWNKDSAIEVRNKPGHITLFKGTDQGQIAGLFNKKGEVQRVEKLLSRPPLDFHGNRALFCFTPDYNMAKYYAAYAKRRANCESVVIVCISISKEAIDNLDESKVKRLYWPNPEWKEVVWRSKSSKAFTETLEAYEDALLIIGTTAKGPVRVFENMKTWEDVTDSCVLRDGFSNQGDPSEQYAFTSKREAREFLSQHGEFEVYVLSDAEVRVLGIGRCQRSP